MESFMEKMDKFIKENLSNLEQKTLIEIRVIKTPIGIKTFMDIIYDNVYSEEIATSKEEEYGLLLVLLGKLRELEQLVANKLLQLRNDLQIKIEKHQD